MSKESVRREQQRALILKFIAEFGRMPPREKPKPDKRTGRQILEAAGYLRKDGTNAEQRGT